MNSSNHPRGQALVLIVFAIVGMVGLTAIAIDGGNAYSDRRHAQNAADTAALAAGLRRVRGFTDWEVTGQTMAGNNGYPNAGSSTVQVYQCSNIPSGAPACTLAPGETHPENYIQVVITSIVHTYFAPVVGIREIKNTVMAIAKAVPGYNLPWMDGNALVSLMPGCKTGTYADPFTISGSQITLVNGSGIFVNSNCSGAFTQNGNNSLTVTPSTAGICVVGGVGGGLVNVSPTPTSGCAPIDLNTYVLPPLDDHSCDSEGTGYIQDMGGGNLYAHPGRYSGVFPPGSSGNLKLGQGIYCLKNGISIQGGWDITTDLNGDGVRDANEGVLLFVENGDVNIGGQSSIYLAAINNSSSGLGADLVNYLLYLPPSNTQSVKITGGAANTYIGTILAPASDVQLSGGTSGESGLNIQTQVIGFTLGLSGNAGLNINYNQSENATTWTNPQLTQYK